MQNRLSCLKCGSVSGNVECVVYIDVVLMFIGFKVSLHLVMAWVGSSESGVSLLFLLSIKVFMRLWN